MTTRMVMRCKVAGYQDMGVFVGVNERVPKFMDASLLYLPIINVTLHLSF